MGKSDKSRSKKPPRKPGAPRIDHLEPVDFATLADEVDDRDRRRGLLTAESIDKKTVSASTGARGRPPLLIRRRVELHVKPVSAGVKMFCKVVVQHQTTEAHRWLAFDRTSSDMPGRTPIERDAATTIEQNTVWETVRRDKAGSPSLHAMADTR